MEGIAIRGEEVDRRLTLEVSPGAMAYRAERRAEALAGLRSTPKEVSPIWLYDARGSALFEEITRLPEYYPTRREREILEACAGSVARASGADTLVELGAGSARKTWLLLDALAERGSLERYIPIDVSESALRESMGAIGARYPGLRVQGLVGDFRKDLGRVQGGRRRLWAFLGGTVGNLKPGPRARFLAGVAEALGPEDVFLLGTDLVKDVRRLEAAYNDARGVTAAFNSNALRVLNAELGAQFVPARFEHRARFDPQASWIEMSLVARRRHRVQVAALGGAVELSTGEALRTEVSVKFRPEQIEGELFDAGLRIVDWWTDRRGDYAVSLSMRAFA